MLGYPTLTMYNNGASLENFKGARDLSALQAFVKRHADAHLPPLELKSHPNPDGQVLELAVDTFAPSLSKGPMFVKFFAPWCGHCKKLAPIWKQLAHHMQNKLTIAEVNCDEHMALCKSHGIQGYPALVFVTSDGLRSQYNGGRKLEQLTSFAEKASSAGLIPIKTEDLDHIVKENQVLYLLLHAGTDNTVVVRRLLFSFLSSNDHPLQDLVRKAAAPLLGSPVIYSSSDPFLFTRFSIPQTSTWALIALKDHDAQTPSSIHHERESSEEKLITWLNTHRLSTTVELTQDTFQSVMNAPQAPLVLIAAVTHQNEHKVRERLNDLGKQWRIRTQGSGLTNMREIVFASMDADKWKDWLKSMYGIQQVPGQHDGLEAVKAVIADHKVPFMLIYHIVIRGPDNYPQRLVYWDMDPSGVPINLASNARVFAAVEAAAAGKMNYKDSENFVERLARVSSSFFFRTRNKP